MAQGDILKRTMCVTSNAPTLCHLFFSLVLDDYWEISRELISLSDALIDIAKREEESNRLNAFYASRREMQAAQAILLLLERDRLTRENFENKVEIFELWGYVSELFEQDMDANS